MTREELFVEQTCTKTLLEVGIPINLQGFRFLRTAILCVVEDSDLIGAITKKLYPVVAKIYNVTPTVIERSIRHSIEVAYERKGMSELNQLFDVQLYNCRYKPSNSEFIAIVAEKLINDIRENEVQASESPKSQDKNDNNDKKS